jgi:CHAT domain-containing protein
MTTELDRQSFASFWAVEDPMGDLRYAKMEVENVRQHFPRESASVYGDEQATRSVLTESGGFLTSHCSHFACHGRFDVESPLLSSLSLAGGEKLTLGEIFEYRLSASRLSVLSACESGLTDIRSLTDEYVGLPSGFLFAGSQAVVSSLWRVADISTSILMMSFYDEVAKQRETGSTFSASKALREAQNWLRTATPEELEQWVEGREGLTDRQRHALKLEIYRPVVGKNGEKCPPFADPIHWAAFHVLGD